MKKVVTCVALLALVASASATVRVFVTGSNNPYGLENNANAFTPTVSTVYANGVNENTYDYYDMYGGAGPLRPGAYPPANSPSGTVADPVLIPSTDFAYLWLQFQSEPAGAKINGLAITIRKAGESVPATDVYTTYYLCNNVNTTGNKRWDGNATPPNYPEWHNNPETMIAITAYGIKNLATAKAEQLWGGGTARIALLGAISAPANGTVYEVLITNISYASPPNPTVAGGAFSILPEPASLLLMGLAGLLIRRR